jgi:hypothetical protein
LQRPLSLRHAHHRGDEHPRHFVEESVPFEADADKWPTGRHDDAMQIPAGVANRRAAVGRESGKVMATGKDFARAAQSSEFDSTDMPTASRLVRREY